MSSVLHPEDEHFRRQSRMSVAAGAPKGLFRSKKEKKASAKAKSLAAKRRAKTGGAGSSVPVPVDASAADPRHSSKRIAWPRYAYYDVAFQFFTEHVLDAEFVQLPEPTRKTIEVGASNSSDFVCAPFKHIMGDYIEALHAGADVIAQFTGPCRLGYYGELQESILRDMGYDFEMLNFSEAAGHGIKGYLGLCKKVNPNMSVPVAAKNMLATLKMVEHLDAYDDYYLANAGFEVERGAFERDRAQLFDDFRACSGPSDVEEAFRAGMARVRAIPLDKPEDPIRIGLVGEYFTAVDAASNLYLEKKLFAMHVELARTLGISNRNIHYNEPNLRRAIPEYAKYDMGPTSSMTIEAAKRYAQEGFDGIVHMKSTGCTPEIDTMPVLQRLSRDLHIPILFLSYDSQTSDAGLDTRLEAFYDMISMRKAR